MNIYKRQMEKLGLSLEQYSKLMDIPIEITKKIINEKEVVKDMNINNFLRKNMFDKHQELEENVENTQLEIAKIKVEDKDIFEHPKIQKIISEYPNDKEFYWYLTEFDKDYYFEKFDVTSLTNLIHRYNFYTTNGRCSGQLSISTIQRVIEKKYDQVGIEPLYDVSKMLYDCFVNEKIEKNNDKINATKRYMRKNNHDDDLLKWYKEFDFKTFLLKKDMKIADFAKKMGLAYSTTCQIVKKSACYSPSNFVILKLKDYVESNPINEEEIIEQPITIIEEIENKPKQVTTIENPLEYSIQNENEILKNLIKERLTEQEKYLIKLFGGNL